MRLVGIEEEKNAVETLMEDYAKMAEECIDKGTAFGGLRTDKLGANCLSTPNFVISALTMLGMIAFDEMLYWTE